MRIPILRYQKISMVFGRLMEIMRSNVDRELKVDILKCFGDLCLGLKDYAENYVDTLLDIT